MWVVLFLMGAFFVGIECHTSWARDLAFIEIAWVEKGMFSTCCKLSRCTKQLGGR